jgi:hypothetical protein
MSAPNLRNGYLSGCVEWQQHGERASLPDDAMHVDAAMVLFHDAPR